MAMRFPYVRLRTNRPIWPLRGRSERPRPIVDVTLVTPTNTVVQGATLDTAADDTVFSDATALALSLDLTNAPEEVTRSGWPVAPGGAKR
jgi:hypothetical protein